MEISFTLKVINANKCEYVYTGMKGSFYIFIIVYYAYYSLFKLTLVTCDLYFLGRKTFDF